MADAFSHDLGYAKDLAGSLIKLQIQNLSSMVGRINNRTMKEQRD